jgi:methylmalonyl-CoA/ethylmalonyl-CoA epimerase
MSALTSQQPALSLPLTLGKLDHYTLIVPDAAACLSFHRDVLGFQFLKTQWVNAGSAPAGEYDMVNHILQVPQSPEISLVITQGLNPESIFSRYLTQFGAGIHHVAYQVDHIESHFDFLRIQGVQFTSDQILIDPIKNLKQVFIHRSHCGYFMELIERTPEMTSHQFTQDNMKKLAQTMIPTLNAKNKNGSA